MLIWDIRDVQNNDWQYALYHFDGPQKAQNLEHAQNLDDAEGSVVAVALKSDSIGKT